MKWIRVPALAGCFALALGVSATYAQQDTTSGSGQTGGSASTSGTQSQANTSQSSGAQGSEAQGNGSSSDKKFVKEAMQGSMAEIKLGQMAQEKASSPEVKQFGQRMVDDHTKLSSQMQPVATQMGLTPPTDLDMKHKAIQKKLEGMSGADFDKAYMKAMVKDHKKDLSEFQKEASSGKNSQVKDAAQQGSQVIQEHLQMAQQIAQQVGAGGGDSKMSGMSGSGASGSGTAGTGETRSTSGTTASPTTGTTAPETTKPQSGPPQR